MMKEDLFDLIEHFNTELISIRDLLITPWRSIPLLPRGLSIPPINGISEWILGQLSIHPSVRSVDKEALELFIKEPYLSKDVHKICELISNFLKNKNIKNETTIHIFRDPEDLEWETLVIEYIVDVKDYDTILKLWDEIGNEVYSNIDQNLAMKITISFRKSGG